MAEIISYIKPLSNLTGIANTDGSFKLYSEQLSSINFDGFAAKRQVKVKVSELRVGQTLMVSEATYNAESVFITKINIVNELVAGVPTDKYFIYYLSDFSMEQAYNYNASYGDSFSKDAEVYVRKDDIDNFVLGNDGWTLTNNGNAIFSNIFARGTIEATSGKIDGILTVGKTRLGTPLLTIGTDLFDGKAFEGESSNHNGLIFDTNNYLLSYETSQSINITSVVIEDITQATTLRTATFTLPLISGETNTLQVGDTVKLSGFTNNKTTFLNDTHQVISVSGNTFTVSIKYAIDLTNPITINVQATSFALNRTFNIVSMTTQAVSQTTNASTVKIYSPAVEFFSVDTELELEDFTGTLTGLNGTRTVTANNGTYFSVITSRVAAGTYTTSLGSITLTQKRQKFKVGDSFNYLSFSSQTGALKVTGTINATSGNFTNTVFVGEAATTFEVSSKQLVDNYATLTTTESHNFSFGDIITVTEVDSTFNGTYTVYQVPSATTFKYAKTAANVSPTTVDPFGLVSSDASKEGVVKVGIGATGITIVGNELDSTSAIYSGAGNFKNADTGFWVDASGRFSIGNQLYFENGNLTVGGTVTASAFAIDQYNYWNTPGNLGDFRVGSANSYLFWNQTNSPNAGDGNLEVKGTITATAGVFSGNIQTTGKIYSGTLDGSGLLTSGIEVASTGIKGIIGGIAAFVLPADGVTKPTITNFEVLNAQITGDKTNAFLVAGDVGVTANNVVVRGYRGGTDQTAAIYNTKNGTATTYAGGTGFYLNDNGFFKVGTNTSNAKFDPTANSNAGLFTVTGEIQATSGYIGGTTSGWLINSNRLTNDAGIYGAGLIATSSPILKRNLAQNPDLSYSLETNTYSNDIAGYKSINDIGTFNNNRFEVSSASAPFGFTLGSIKLNGSANRTSTFTGTAGSNAITCSFDGETSSMYPGMFVFGTGIAAGAKINLIIGKVLYLNLVNTGAVSGTVTLLNPYTFTKPATGTSGQLTITVSPNNFGIVAGMRVTGTGIGAGVTVVSIASNVITLSGTNSGTVSGNATFFIENTPIINHFGGFEFNGADVPYTFTAQNYVASAYFYIPSLSSSLAGRTITLSVDSGATWTNGTATAATLVSGSWVRASTVITMTASGAGAPNIVAKLSGALNSTTDYKQILTANWMITEGSSLQSYFDENFPMGVNVGGYAIEYEKAFYSGTTYANSGIASLQLGHGGNIYASTGKIGGLNVNSNRLYATNGNGDFVIGDIGTQGDYPEYGLRIDLENYWSQTQIKHEKKYQTTLLGLTLPIFKIETSGSYLGDSSNPLGTVSEFNSVFSNGVSGAVITLANIEDADNGGLYRNVSGISSNYYNTSGTIIGSTYIAQYDATNWILGPNVKIAGTITAGGGTTPVGSIVMWSEATLPSGWILCNGQSTASYPLLAGVVGANVPNLLDRFIVAAGSAYGLKSTGGASNHNHANTAAIDDDTGSHNHGSNISVNTHNHSDNFAGGFASSSTTGSGSTFLFSGVSGTYRYHTHGISGNVSTNNVTNQGGNMSGSVSNSPKHSHTITMSNNNASNGLPPYYALYFIIYTGQPS